MIDTITLSLRDYEIENDPILNVIQPTLDLSTGELKGDFHLFTINGDPVCGKKAFLNDPLFNLTLRPTGDSVRCFLKFSFPKVYLGNNFYPINIHKSCGVLLNLNKRLRESGIRTNIFHSDLSRIDIFKNVETDENFSSYTNLFSLLRAKRMKRRDFPTMFLWQNGQQQIVAYDKIQEFKRRHIPTTDLPKNVIRFERRLLNKTKIKKTLGFSNVEDLLENPDTVKHEFQHSMEDLLFRREPEEIEVISENELENQLRHFKKTKGRYWRRKLLEGYGLRYLHEHTSVETLLDAFAKVQGHEMARTNLRRELEQAQIDLAFMEKGRSGRKSQADLYAELRAKVLE